VAKTCNYKDCSNPVFSGGRCRWHVEKKPANKQRKKIKPLSDKHRERLAEYKLVADKFLKENPICLVDGCKGESTLHHSKGRVGDNLTDVSTFRNLCWPHHKYYEEHPEEARALGITQSRL
jgi:hypothetical protein